MSWLYEELAKQWSQWLPKQALETVKMYEKLIKKNLFCLILKLKNFDISGGYYSWQIRPGFRIVVLNTNYCSRFNFWSFYNPIDPADHLKWLIKELLIAEQVGDSVHIVGHIVPEKRECTQGWLYNYLAIVERFKDTIVAQFYGHKHSDELKVLYSNKNFSQPIGYSFVAPSLSTYNVYNPSYRMYKTDNRGNNFAEA
jgi:sphingomyelin phosphodiesterase